MKRLLQILLPLAFLASLHAADQPLEFSALDGKARTPLVAGDKKGIVLVFVSPFCPTSNTFTPEINKIAKEYEGRFAFYLIEADADLTPADAKKHQETFEIAAPILFDPEHKLAKLTKAKTTPEAVVLAANGDTLYQGRVNDLYKTPTNKQKEPKTNDLRDALAAILAGKPVANPVTKAIGCSISGL